ncbi:MAG: Hsp20 family protein, partial [Acetobacter cibinongensis]
VEEGEERVYLHRGIASRQFQKAFVLAEGIEIGGAWLDNGLLHIDLFRPQPDVRVKRIEIMQPGQKAAETAAAPVLKPRSARMLHRVEDIESN